MGGWGGGHGEEVRDGLKVSSVDIEREEVPKCGCSHTERSVDATFCPGVQLGSFVCSVVVRTTTQGSDISFFCPCYAGTSPSSVVSVICHIWNCMDNSKM